MVYLTARKAALAETIVFPETLSMMQEAADFTIKELRIRKADKSDGESLALLAAELGYPTTPSQARERLVEIKRAGDTVLVADCNAKVVGMIVLHRTRFLHREPDGRIATLVVSGSYRNFGIGAQLIEAAEVIFRDWGCERVEVTSGTQREAAHRFYQREGYFDTAKRFVKPLSIS